MEGCYQWISQAETGNSETLTHMLLSSNIFLILSNIFNIFEINLCQCSNCSIICTVLLGQANLNPPDFNFSGRPAQVWGESSMPDPAVCVDVLIMISVD